MPQMHGRVDDALPVGPDLIVVGTGRSGTLSLAQALNGAHEPKMLPVTYLAAARSHGWLSDRDVATVLINEVEEWPPVVVDYKQSELIDITAKLWEPQYLWVARNPADAVASMVKKRWYRPSDDQYPPGYLIHYRRVEEGVGRSVAVNDAGNRTRGDMTNDFTRDEWMGMGQVERCGWWWNYCNRQIAIQLSRLDRDRWMFGRIEDSEWPERLGLTVPTLNTSNAEPVTGWEPYVEEMAGRLGY